ncbi:MAG: GIN domain-containing protein [Aurantibacter sp.]
MKNLLIILSLVFCFQGYSQRQPKIKGNRNVVVVEDELPDFSAIELNDDLDIVLERSDTPGYFIEADDNLIDILKFKVSGNTLEISSFYKVTSKKKMDIIIRFKELEAITLNDGKLVLKEKLSAYDNFQINTYGSSKLELLASAPVVTINMEGNSSGDLNIESDSLSINLKDRIDVRIYSVSEINNVQMHRNASARMEGTTDELHVELLDSSNFKGSKLQCDIAKVDISGSANARVDVVTELELTSSGSAKTNVYGSGKITLAEFLDTSQLHKEK